VYIFKEANLGGDDAGEVVVGEVNVREALEAAVAVSKAERAANVRNL
jgi:hypothetical protein